MTRKQRFAACITYFQQAMPEPETELTFGNTYELLVAVILSAQCTDKRVNLTTPAFFQKYPDIPSLAKAGYDDVFALIKSISFPGNKSRHLIGMAAMVTDKFNGTIPMTVEELVQLPGVGRKTANVITSIIDKQPNMAVDTHVFRVSARIGLTVGAKNPLQTEMQLVKHLPKDLIHLFHHWLILHGRYVCIARTPKCFDCGLRPVCKYYNTVVVKLL
ncbi:MAG TPA: endonuclease III [Flavisolibacter sp.]|jgi:endonuclease-3|nr:endonuclease III [Flavisolibacter sp.]